MTELLVCPLCEEAVEEDVDARPINGDGRAHGSCLMRVALGGIGHLEDHGFWCVVVGDPDGGRTRRQSGIEVAAWVQDRAEFVADGQVLSGYCGHCRRVVDSRDAGHRVTSVVRGGRGVECVARGDIVAAEGGPLGG